MARDPTDSPAAPGPRDRGRWAVLYDPDCGFCRWSLARLLARDRSHRLRPVALGTAEADELLWDLASPERAASWHLVSPQQLRTSGGAAAVPLLRLLPGGRLPAAALARMPALTERVYKWVAGHRSTLSKALPVRSKARADEAIRRHQDASAGCSRTAR